VKAAGANVTPTQIRQLVRLHEPLIAIVDHTLEDISTYAPDGKHARPNDKVRLAKLLEDLKVVDLFTYQPGRAFVGHPIMPRNMPTQWLSDKEYISWIQGHMDDLAKKQESGTTLQPRNTLSSLPESQLKHYAAKLQLDKKPPATRERFRHAIEQRLRGRSDIIKLVKDIFMQDPGVTREQIQRHCARLQDGGMIF